MEPVSPNGPAGDLLRTRNGGTSWSLVASLHDKKPQLPCLAPIRFVTPSNGWMGQTIFGGTGCAGQVYRTENGGTTWRAVRMPRLSGKPFFDLPYFAGRFGVTVASVGFTPARTVAFVTSADGGRTWTLRSLRRLRSCTTTWLRPFVPTSVATTRTWWIIGGRARPVVELTTDSGRNWRTIEPSGLPDRGCSVMGVSAATQRDAWIVARVGRGTDTALFQTHDGGRTWMRAPLLSR
jgi:photosystem II stability/assembly factor-like uncharacterized protein